MLPKANLGKPLFNDENYFFLKLIRYMILTFNWLKTQRKYKSETNPFRIIWVNPGEVYEKKIHYPRQRLPVCVVGKSDFDQHNEKIVAGQEQLKQKVVDGLDWEKTDMHEKQLENFLKKGRTKEQLFEYYDNQVELYNSIKQRGFKPPLGIEEGKSGIELNWKPKSISVNIGRDGSFYLYTGSHRLRIAKILKLDKIPVKVTARHESWQKIREEVVSEYNSGSLSEHNLKYKDHPDISYLLE